MLYKRRIPEYLVLSYTTYLYPYTNQIHLHIHCSKDHMAKECNAVAAAVVAAVAAVVVAAAVLYCSLYLSLELLFAQ